MVINEVLTSSDLSLLKSYISEYGDYYSDVCDLDYFLRFWETNKSHFYEMFGDKLILEQSISFSKSVEELMSDINDECWKWGSKSKEFLEEFRDYFYDLFYRGEIGNDYYETFGNLINDETLIKNVYSNKTFTISGKFTKTGKSITVSQGCKVAKIIGKIAEACGMNMDSYEEFRKAHSQVLNQKKVNGTLCLSIHPMDFLTMSDNNCGWSSCMTWMDGPGDYRLGTIEMMNSPCVIVAYLKAKDDMNINGYTWNSKKWRQLLIVDPKVILGNKQYPYSSDDLQGYAMKWIKSLCEKFDYGHYDDEVFCVFNDCSNRIKDKTINFSFTSSYMYNDIYDDRFAYLNPKVYEKGENVYIHFSGPAVCACCGTIIEYDNCTDPSHVICNSCSGDFLCDCCKEWINGDPIVLDNGTQFCQYCYENELVTCEVCEEKVLEYRSIPIVIGYKNEDEDYSNFDYSYRVYVCDCCLRDEKYKELYGEIHKVSNNYSFYRTDEVFFLEDITDEGLDTSFTTENTKKTLKNMRDANSYEERMEIMKNIAWW